MKPFIVNTWVVAALVVTASGCGRQPPASANKEYPIQGKVTAVAPEKKTVTLDHNDIPGLMTAMEMEFALESAAVAGSLSPGDEVEGVLVVRPGNEMVIVSLKKKAGSSGQAGKDSPAKP